MTKKYIAFFICLCVLLTVLAQGLPPVLALLGVDAQEEAPEQEGFVWPESKLTWMSYRDFCLASAVKAYENPELYLGYEAVFAVDRWGSFVLEDNFEKESRASQWPNKADLMDDEGNGLRVVITDYHLDTEEKALWYKVAAPEGETLPELLQEYPYVLFYSNIEPDPALYIQPQYAMFAGDTVEIKVAKEAACRSAILNTADLPLMFTVSADWNDNAYYDLGDTTGWNEDLADREYRYVDASSVILIPAEAAAAYVALMETRYSRQFNYLLSQIPESVLEQLSPQHYESLEAFLEELIVLENVQHTTEVQVGELTLPVAVKGRLPQEGVQLQAAPVTAETVLSEGFDIENPDDIIVALDIKLINEADGSEWQPAEGESVQVSIGVAAFGCEELQMVRVHHKHGEKIDVLDVFMVVDGAVTLETGGFSIYVVDRVGNTSTTGKRYDANSTITLRVGVPIYLYSGRNNNTGTWEVTDTEGALYYTVHSNSTSLGHDGMTVPWIKIIPLKTAENVTLVYKYTNNGTKTESYTVRVLPPEVPAGDTQILYIKDEVNTTGSIRAVLVDKEGNEIPNGLDGAAFKWERSDGLFIVPAAYGKDYASVNIARDHAGLVENRKETDGSYELVTYTLTATLADGSTPKATYTVYYQSEIINAGFESPALGSNVSNYIMFPNGWEGLYWKTTAPGTNDKLTQDIEFGNLNGGSGTSFGVTQDADGRGGGDQFAELNAENVGALYQDIISVPHEIIEWDFSHAPRQEQTSWAANLENKMYIIIGATEDAQKLTTQQDLKKLTDKLTAAQKNDADFRAGKKSYVLKDENAIYDDGVAYYEVWYHDAGTVREGNNNANNAYNASNNYGWTEISGQYEVPEGQYRTRLFFVSDNTQANAGNLIDKAKAGQYKTYLIEYYEETFVNGEKVVQHIVDRDEFGEALVYSSVKMEELDYFLTTRNDYLHEIMINGGNYPYDIRYAGEPSIYIEQYPGKATDPMPGVGKDYDGYQIVVQVYVRDTVIAVKKELKLPGKMTEEQKLNLMNSLTADGGAGYLTYFNVSFPKTNENGEIQTVILSDQTAITKRDPAGKYTGYVSIGNDDNGDALSYDDITYTLTETGATELEGLVLDSVVFTVTLYRYGVGDTADPETYTFEHITNDTPLQVSFKLTKDQKIAEILVENIYREKETTIYYVGVGNGKVKFLGEGGEFMDIPTETLDFYSEPAKGALPVAGEGASFVGWFKDPACTDPVTAKDGKIGDDGSFKPNANIISTEAVYFYAKFESGSVTINRTDGEPNQTFLYRVQEKNTGMIIYVSLTCDEEGNGSVLINEAPEGEYTVTELGDWSWRYPQPESQTKDLVFTPKNRNVTFDFAGKHNKDQWLNGYSPVEENK